MEGIGCWHYDFGGDGTVDSAISYTQITDNRDAFMTWFGLQTGIWQWNSDNGPEADFPDELGADLLKNDVDGDIDGDFTNSTIDLDDDYDAIFDWFDVDDANDGVWDYFVGRSCDGTECTGEWRITAYYPGSTYFAASQNNITHEITYKKAEALGASSGLFSPGNLIGFAVILMALLIAGAIYYQRVQQQRQVQALRGILTDAMMQLEASNEYIAAIFDCYKSLVKHFRKYGFMKKVYETAREFEAAVRTAFNMVPADQLDDFLSIFEEARYSEHTIDATHRDRAMQTLGAITNSLTMSLGEEAVVKRIDTSSIYDNLTKAGEFVAADGTVRQAGIVEGEGTDFKI